MLTNVVRPQRIAAGATATAFRSSQRPSRHRTKDLTKLCQPHVRSFYSSPLLFGRRHIIHEGRFTQQDDDEKPLPVRTPYYFDTAYSIFAKRPTRPFPPPFMSRPSGSFSDPLTTHDRVKYRQARIDGQLLRGITNGDDAILVGHHNFLVVNDGVGAWAQKERGHAALWSRLIAHYWAVECEAALAQPASNVPLDYLKPRDWLQTAFDKTQTATRVSGATDILGTTTATSALLHHKSQNEPVVIATQLGDCAIHIIRPGTDQVKQVDEASEVDEEVESRYDDKIIYKTEEQWHWFDCPRQLGTNSPDTPDTIVKTDTIDVQIGDIVLVMSDGVTDNLWEYEIIQKVCDSFRKWRSGDPEAKDGVVYVARELMNAARVVAMDPYAESPYMERALDEGIAAEGGKLDDISVVIGICQKRDD